MRARLDAADMAAVGQDLPEMAADLSAEFAARAAALELTALWHFHAMGRHLQSEGRPGADVNACRKAAMARATSAVTAAEDRAPFIVALRKAART